jgi:hypothetical protein
MKQPCDLDLTFHPHCVRCTILLEPERNEKTLCWCGKYHNAPSMRDERLCRRCAGEKVPTGQPAGEPQVEPAGEPFIVEDGEEEHDEFQI